MRLRPFHIALLCCVLLCGMAACAQTRALTVNAAGGADYRSIQAAIDALTDSSATPRVIRIAAGTYREKLFISKHNIIFIGAGRDATIITQD
ncbi:MAG: hypothetical protein EOO11_12665, partial [Chitinophagaceae bacterium]